MQAIAEVTGDIAIIPDEFAGKSVEQAGHMLAGWFQFRALWQEQVAEHDSCSS